MTEAFTLSSLDSHFADFIVRIDRNPGNELWWGAALASNSAGRGHSCCNLYDVRSDLHTRFLRSPHASPPSDIRRWLEVLQQCSSVGAPGAYTPLVLEPGGKLYLHRCWQYEQQIAAGISARSPILSTDDERLDEALDRYFPPRDGDVDMQRAAARMALTSRFSVISGGPGTGKTATVARILALLLDMAGDAMPEIALAAPTGKAALRLHQAIQQAADSLALPDEVSARLPSEVRTIHRLLGVRGRTGRFRHTRDNRLSCDILVVDEASMVDLQLMAALMEALRDDARVILLGDRNQLASVKAGAVLADICDSAGRGGVSVTHLTRSYRFSDSSGIAAVSRLISSGDGVAATALVQSGQFPDVIWRPLPAGKTFNHVFTAAIRDGYAGYARAETPAEALTEFASFRVLSPHRAGTCGIENLNRLCQGVLSPKRTTDTDRPQPVMITGNNYDLGLFNGDTGVIMGRDASQAVWFESPEGGLRRLSVVRLPPYETAFALTVHKSQGSEFDRVLLILPEQMSDVLSRELLYTAVTRARRSIEIWGTAEVFRQAVERRTVRDSGLCERLSGETS